MEKDGILLVVSEENLLRHKRHLEEQILRLSVLDSSDGRVGTRRMRQSFREERAVLEEDIRCHRRYFASFTERSRLLPPYAPYASAEGFLYDAFLDMKAAGNAFYFLWRDGRGRLCHGRSDAGLSLPSDGVLAVDLYEHAYYGDYGFDREGYIKSALSHLNLSLLDEKTRKGIAK